MSQHDYNIANGGGAAVRSDLNLALAAILSQNSGATAPATTKPFMPWYDTTSGVLKIRNPADDGWLTITDTAGELLATIADGSVTPAKLSQKITQGAAVASTSGTSIDFTGIPSWVKRITVMFAGVSTSGSNQIGFIISSDGTYTASGYLGTGSQISGTNATQTSNPTSQFTTSPGGGSTCVYHGNAIFCLVNAATNTWSFSSVLGRSDVAATTFGGGSKSLSGTLTSIRVTTVGGTDTFDAGSINILYEG